MASRLQQRLQANERFFIPLSTNVPSLWRSTIGQNQLRGSSECFGLRQINDFDIVSTLANDLVIRG
jgi:hypothetical protein